ncbi:DUF3224 domain-containing protein [Micromonospora sp. NBC_00898]|uniref:DUF3224 domain-containing protein n=1 Tax=Micromonospora sp. NBC_00898 TaxID=2975981 RepID=UPI0038667421
MATMALIRSCSDGNRPVVGSTVTSPTVKTPNCMASSSRDARTAVAGIAPHNIFDAATIPSRTHPRVAQQAGSALSWTIVPDTGTDQLRELRGGGQIIAGADGGHRYVLEYELPRAAGSVRSPRRRRTSRPDRVPPAPPSQSRPGRLRTGVRTGPGLRRPAVGLARMRLRPALLRVRLRLRRSGVRPTLLGRSGGIRLRLRRARVWLLPALGRVRRARRAAPASPPDPDEHDRPDDQGEREELTHQSPDQPTPLVRRHRAHSVTFQCALASV